MGATYLKFRRSDQLSGRGVKVESGPQHITGVPEDQECAFVLTLILK